MLHETKANNQPQRNRGPARNRKPPGQVDRDVAQEFLAISSRAQNSVHLQFSLPGRERLLPVDICDVAVRKKCDPAISLESNEAEPFLVACASETRGAS